MRIGIDLGGSHIAIGLIEEGKIIKKCEYNFLQEDKKQIGTVIQNFLEDEIYQILQTIEEKNIEMIGICVPRKTTKWYYYQCL